MTIVIVRPEDLGESEISRWRELQGANPSLDNPFLSVEFTLAMGRLRDYVRVAVIQDNNTITGFSPMSAIVSGLANLWVVFSLPATG